MAASKTTIFIVFILCFQCTLLVSVYGQAKRSSCSTSTDCELLCFGEKGRVRQECVLGKCICLEQKTETELAKTITCKTDSDCPDSGCPPSYFYLCVLGKCTCITK
ncbi:hypothetical protein Bca4012_008656 [Brassica carinata]|uniref:Uncharacterized protein n=1 Tax=Brassica carinata TaxID=52824 RepID=A0A8X7Q0J8_BRACI|nr:hypothetical protein Bca52824_079947 [Brassica carinata]